MDFRARAWSLPRAATWTPVREKLCIGIIEDLKTSSRPASPNPQCRKWVKAQERPLICLLMELTCACMLGSDENSKLSTLILSLELLVLPSESRKKADGRYPFVSLMQSTLFLPACTCMPQVSAWKTTVRKRLPVLTASFFLVASPLVGTVFKFNFPCKMLWSTYFLTWMRRGANGGKWR